jgi:hypothetical protein
VTHGVQEFDVRGGKVYAYEGLLEPGGGASSGDVYVAFREFMEMVTGACDALGKDFRSEFDATTKPCTYPVISYQQVVSGKGK